MTQREFEYRFEKYRGAIYKIAHSLWASPMDAEEAVARVRARLLQRVSEVESDGFLPLWRTALQNDAISYLRKRQREVEIAEAKAVAVDAASLVDAGFSPIVLFALSTLSEAERFVVLSHAVHGISLRKIAESLEASATTVMKIYRVARAKLVFELHDYALNCRLITPEDVSRAVEWASRVMQEHGTYQSTKVTG